MRTYSSKSPKIVAILLLSLIIALSSSPCALGQQVTVVGTISENFSGIPIANANITVYVSGTTDLVDQTTSDSEGYYEIPGLTEGSYTFVVGVQGYVEATQEVIIGGFIGGEDTLVVDIQLNPLLGGGGGGDKEVSESNPFFFLYQLFFMVTIALIISLVMYSKIKRENLLKNAQRNRIYEYIKDKPGTHYRAILTDLNLTMGVLTYHLNRLEKAQFIKSRQDGMYRRFFVKSTRTEVRFFLSEIQESILRVISENQGISQSRISDKINVSRKVVHYHVNILDQAGLIYMESRGRESALFINKPSVTEVAEGS